MERPNSRAWWLNCATFSDLPRVGTTIAWESAREWRIHTDDYPDSVRSRDASHRCDGCATGRKSQDGVGFRLSAEHRDARKQARYARKIKGFFGSGPFPIRRSDLARPGQKIWQTLRPGLLREPNTAIRQWSVCRCFERHKDGNSCLTARSGAVRGDGRRVCQADKTIFGMR